MEYIKCILCNNNNNELFMEENNYKAIKCKTCGLIYVNPRPTIEEIKKIYESEASLTTNINTFIKLKEKKLLIAKRDIRNIKKFKNHGRLLDIGSAAGYFLCTAKKIGYDCYGLEINKFLTQYSRDKLQLNVQCGTISDSNFPKSFFDIIYMRYVLSHLYNPVNELLKLNLYLKNNGLFIFETGNAAELKAQYLKKMGGLGLPEHLFHFSRENIIQLLAKTNFRLIKTIEYSTHLRNKLYNAFGKKIRSSYSELKNAKSNKDISIKQKIFARMDYALVMISRILPKKNHWLSIIYISQKNK